VLKKKKGREGQGQGIWNMDEERRDWLGGHGQGGTWEKENLELGREGQKAKKMCLLHDRLQPDVGLDSWYYST